MNRSNENKKAWEQVYDHRNYDEKDILNQLKEDPARFLNPEIKPFLDVHIKPGHTVMQFCANNGRELLALAKTHNITGIGFDLAENMVKNANEKAAELDADVTFYASDILEIPEKFHHQADTLMLTVGTTAWFKDINAFFEKCYHVLKPGGTLVMHEIHPVTLMLAAEGEENYDSQHPFTLVNNYFEGKEWISTGGMGYMSDITESHPFFDYSHTVADHINGLIKVGFTLNAFHESPQDHGCLFGDKVPPGCPLSMTLIATK